MDEISSKRNQRTKDEAIALLKQQNPGVIHIDPWVIFKDGQELHVLRFEETGVRKIFVDKA